MLLFSILTFPLGRAAAQTTNIPARITQSVDEKNVFVLKGNVHPFARPEFDQGVLPDALPIGRMLLLLQRSPVQEASLTHLLDDQQNKSSRNYHAWLTPEQFGKQFGPADADIQAVTAWLTSQGFTGMKIGPGRQVIEFSGTAGQVRNAFRTEIHRYAVNGEEHAANTNDPQIPVALAPVVAGVVSLHNFPRKSHARVLGQFRRTVSKPGLEPLFTFPNPFNGMSFYGLGPGDFATIYNSKPLIAAGNDGTGQTIAIVGETNLKVQDVQQFRKMFALSANFDATNVVLNGEDPGITSIGEEGEADLDVEWSGAVAPGATVKLVVSASTLASAGIDLSALYIVEHNLAGVMSESYGTCENALGSAGNAFYNSLWEQAAAQGITVVLSSGDGGSAGCDDFNTPQPATQGLAVSGLASTPFNVSVGGTDFDQVNNWAAYWNPTNDPTGTSAISYIPEIPWSENCAQIGLTGCGASAPSGSLNIAAGSGGASSVYGKPNWQMGVAGVPNDNHRDQPDVSLFASPGFDGTGYVYCQSDQTISGAHTCDLNASTSVLDFGIIGGTSASAPAFAGIMALVNQKQATTASPAPRQGNANYVLYALAKKAGASCTSTAAEAAGCIFNDVTRGNSALPTGLPGVGTNSVPCKGGSLNCSVTTAATNGVLVDPGHPTVEAWTATAGYDMTTGLGTVNVNNLATNWDSVSTIPTTTTLTLSPTTGITHGTGENVTVGITVKATAGTGVPAGDVSLIAMFPDGTTQGFDQFTLVSGAASGVQTQSMPGGTYNVSAHYTGDGTNAPSDSTPVQVTVGKESSQTFVVVPSFDSQGNLLNGNATSVTYGSRYVIRMYVTDKNGVASATGPPSPACYQVNELTCPSGMATLTANGAPVDGGTFTLNNAGYTRDIAPTLTGGTYSLVAQYSGDNSYQTSTSAPDTFTVTPAPTQMNLYSTITNPLVGIPFEVNVGGCPDVPRGVPPTGTISLFDGDSLIGGPVSVTGSGCFNGNLGLGTFFQVTLNTGGDHSITAKYSGDASYGPSASNTIVVHPLYPTTITVTPSTTNINYGQSVTITASVATSGKSPTMTGTFTFYGSYTQIPGPVTGTLSTDASGNQVLTATVTTTPLGVEYIQSTYSGDPNFEGAFQQIFINVNVPDFSLSIPSTAFNITAGQPGTLQISIVPTTNNSSPVTLSCNGNMPVGYSCSLQPATVNLASGATSTATLILSSLSGAAAPMPNAITRKRVGFYFFPFGSNPLWPLSLGSAVAALLLLCLARKSGNLRPSLGFGLICIIVVIIGCGGGNSTPPPPPPPTGPFATSTTVSTSSAKVAQGAPVTFTAKVTGQGNPSGNVTYYANGGWIGQSNLTAGTATLNTTLPFAGIWSITAQYAGDSNNLTSTSPGVGESVTGSTVMQVNGQTSTLFHSVNVTVTIQ